MTSRSANPNANLPSSLVAADAKPTQASVLVIIVNYRTPDLTIACLDSLAPEVKSLPAVRVVVVDNGSQDDSPQRIEEAIRRESWESWLTLMALPENLGFAGGNNAGLRAGDDARYILLLNSDTICHPGVLRACIHRMDLEPRIGAMSCLLLNEDGSVQNVARRFPTPIRLLVASTGLDTRLPRWFEWADIQDLGWDRRTKRRDVGWLGGAFLFVRGDLVQRIGLLDDDFFFFGEDVEFSHRVWQAGYRCHYDPETSITHLGGQSSSNKIQTSGWRAEQIWRARYLTQRKCYGRSAELFVRTLDLVSWAVRVPWRRLRRGKGNPAYREAVDVFGFLARSAWH